MLRTHVSFEVRGADVHAAARSAELLTRSLLATMQRQGVATEHLGGVDYAADFRVRFGRRSFYGMLGAANDGIRQWLLFFESELPIWRRWFGGKDETEYLVVLQSAHAALIADSRIESVRWYTPSDWNDAPDERWHSDPLI